MIKTRVGYLWASDLSRELYGREDGPELVSECIAYLKHSHRVHPRPEPQSSPSHRNVRQALIAAHVRRAIGSRPELGELEDRIQGQQERLERQAAAIDRLLAFVPRREPPVLEQRLEELRLSVLSTAEAYAEDADVEISAVIAPETDLDTPASHRISVLIGEGAGLSTKDLLDLEDYLNEHLIEITVPSESRALVVEVVPGQDTSK